MLAFAGLALASCGGPTGLDGTGAGSLPFDGRSPLVPPVSRMRVLVELRRPSLATQMRLRRLTPTEQRAAVASLDDEVRALEGALRAKGVRLGRAVTFARVWAGFAATVDARDLPKLRALGLRAEAVRRFYGAASSGVAAGSFGSKGGGQVGTVALLDSGVDVRAHGLGGRVVSGFDAVGGPRRGAGRHGTQVAQVLAQALGPAGGRIVSVRVAGLQVDARTGARSEVGTTDQLLAGLERTVDPDGNGDVSDHIPVALVGVNSPYAGFADSPDAVAAGAARALGTLVVAPAGNEGPGGGGRAGSALPGTVGSPAAAPGVLAVGALDGGGGPALPSVRVGIATHEGRALLRGTLLGGGGGALRAPVAALAGPSQASPRGRGRAPGGSPLEYFSVDAKPRARGRVVIVPNAAGPSLSTRAAAAAEAGAAALVVCEPDPTKPLTAIPDGPPGLPVVGVRGTAARTALDLTPHDGGLAFLSTPERRSAPKSVTPAPTSSRGPTYSLAPKPDIAAPGTARIDGQTVSGTSVAAARAAAAAVAVRNAKPGATPDDVAAALIGTAHPLGPVLATGAGELDAARARQATLLVEPATLGLPRASAAPAPVQITRQFTVANQRAQQESVTLAAKLPSPLTATVAPATITLQPGMRQRVTLTVTGSARAGFASGRITARAGAATTQATIGLPIGPPPPATLGALTLVGNTGVRFTAGAVEGRGATTAVQPIGNLRLELQDPAGRTARVLTPVGGAPDLLPGEYAYTLTKAARAGLKKGAYSFEATATAPAGGPPVTRKSPSFTIR